MTAMKPSGKREKRNEVGGIIGRTGLEKMMREKEKGGGKASY